MSQLRCKLLLVTGLLTIAADAIAEHTMVLIARSDSPVANVSPIDLRKLYLGFTVESDSGPPVRAVCNASNNQLWEIFLQDVMGMSARSYDRRLLSLTLQSGRHRPPTYDEIDEVLDSVLEDPYAVTFAWIEDVETRDDLKILRVLWHH